MEEEVLNEFKMNSGKKKPSNEDDLVVDGDSDFAGETFVGILVLFYEYRRIDYKPC